jgi:hypothetical protein
MNIVRLLFGVFVRRGKLKIFQFKNFELCLGRKTEKVVGKSKRETNIKI